MSLGPPRPRTTSAFACAALVLAAACTGDDPSARIPEPAVTDSAGVRVVQNRVPAAGVPTYATLAPRPDLEIFGGGEGPLRGIERAVTLPDGTVAVANTSSLEVRFHAPDGTLAASAGGEGIGFGKLLALSRMGHFGGDTVWVHDLRTRRLTLFRADGETVADSEAPRPDLVVGHFADHSFLLAPGWTIQHHLDAPSDTVRRDPAAWGRWWPATGEYRPVGTFPHDQVYAADEEDGGRLMVGRPPFARQTVHAVGPGRFYVGDQDRFEVRGYDPDGTLREIIRLEGVSQAVAPEARQAAVDVVRRSDTVQARVEALVGAMPSTRPAYGRLLLDGLGHLWVGEHVVDLTPARNWLVFTPSGALAGIVAVPVNFRVFEVGIDYVLGASPGVADTEVVRRYPLERLGGG